MLLGAGLIILLAGCGASSATSSAPAACTWHRQNPGPRVSEDLEAISFVDIEHGWVVGGIGGPVIRATTDGGVHWQAQRVPGQNGLSGVSFVDDQHGWVVGEAGSVFATTDGGKSWVKETSRVAPSLNLYGVSFVDRTHGWIVGEKGSLEITSDGGRSWSALRVGVSDDLDSVTFTDLSNGWILTANGRVLRSHDGGHSWRVVYTPASANNEEIAGLAVLNAHRVFASGSQDQGASNYGSIARSADGGATWQHYVANNFDDQRFGPVAFTDREHGWVASPLDGNFWYTADGGASWSSATSPTADEIHAMLFRDPTHGWAVASNDTILACTA